MQASPTTKNNWTNRGYGSSEVYIACGISGAIQHVAGMKESGILISINTDPNAPINDIADYVITGSVEEVVPKMIQYYKQHSK